MEVNFLSVKTCVFGVKMLPLKFQSYGFAGISLSY